MKRRMCPLVILLFAALFLSACSSKDSDAVLWYQEGPAEICGTLQGESGTYTITLSLERRKTDGTRDVTLTYQEPEELAGMVFRLRGEEIFAVYDTVEIPLSTDAAGKLFAPADLFSLREEDITEIQKGEAGETIIRLVRGQDHWEISTDAEGLPTSITATAGGRDLSLAVTSFVQTDA